MTSARYATNDRFGIEITGDLLDLIQSRSTTPEEIQSVGDVNFRAGECPGLGGWVAVVRMAGTGWWTITTAEQISPAGLVRFASGEEFPNVAADSDITQVFQPGDTVRQHAPAMTVESVTSGEDVHCVWIEGAARRRGSYPASSLCTALVHLAKAG